LGPMPCLIVEQMSFCNEQLPNYKAHCSTSVVKACANFDAARCR
jgi:hypothetical protein